MMTISNILAPLRRKAWRGIKASHEIGRLKSKRETVEKEIRGGKISTIHGRELKRCRRLFREIIVVKEMGRILAHGREQSSAGNRKS